ncbi:MAG: hypothetical protein ACE5J7_03180 [Candidatus Aenigmatarchaeota archaeon]
MAELITFETIRTVHMAEKREQLSKLPPDFFDSVGKWFGEKSSLRDPLSIMELKTVKDKVDDIMNRRQRKIIMSAMRTIRGGVPPENMTEDEQKFFDRAVTLFKSFKLDLQEKLSGADFFAEEKIEEARRSLEEAKAIVEPVPVEKPAPQPVQEAPKPVEVPAKPIKKPADPNKMNVKILTEMPKFVGRDFQPYGPFKAGDMVQLPKEIASVLIARKAAEEDVRMYL